jgi:hypothetical protein
MILQLSQIFLTEGWTFTLCSLFSASRGPQLVRGAPWTVRSFPACVLEDGILRLALPPADRGTDGPWDRRRVAGCDATIMWLWVMQALRVQRFRLLVAVRDTTSREIVSTELDDDLVAGEDADVVLPHLS